ncbi:enolase C-terminal domain-like protein [Streptomyces sp. ISL-11]|uniref:enolase C-terminal domain-like protein n=1 Tax=Streptomyces sp. ISL-11 TaxID=2819174 RepID=UPI001BEBE776|nr:enolase C-terminal domain-like protein [Streptomyces sp. ISL-11]MBT2387766.1 mandelate racemase [Streptomyces sp. ISL-11]
MSAAPDARIDRLDATAYTFPTDAPEADGTIAWDSVTVVVVEVRSGTTTGLGWTYAAADTASAATGLLRDRVLGRDVFDVAGAHEAMVRAVRNAGRQGMVGCAVSAVDIALWDLKARLLGLPLARLIGAVHETVPLYGSGGFTTYHDTHLATQLTGWVHGQGIPRVKIKIGESWGTATERDLDRVRRARRTIGPHAALYVDANGAYTRKQAVRVGRALADMGVAWFEEPVSSDDLEGLRVVRDLSVCDVAAGEYGYDLPYFARLAPVVDCLQADATRCGGLTVWLRAAALAEAHGLEISAHCAPHAHAHAAACVPNLRHIEWFHDHARLESTFFTGALDPTGGTVRPGAGGGTGHGMAFRHDEAVGYRVR